MAELRGAADAGDTVAIRRGAHTLRSNAVTFGASTLSGLCGELEASVGVAGDDEVARLVSAIALELERARASLAAERAAVGQG